MVDNLKKLIKMPPLKQKSKRKASDLIKESEKPTVVQESESDYESDEVFLYFSWLCSFFNVFLIF